MHESYNEVRGALAFAQVGTYTSSLARSLARSLQLVDARARARAREECSSRGMVEKHVKYNGGHSLSYYVFKYLQAVILHRGFRFRADIIPRDIRTFPEN